MGQLGHELMPIYDSTLFETWTLATGLPTMSHSASSYASQIKVNLVALRITGVIVGKLLSHDYDSNTELSVRQVCGESFLLNPSLSKWISREQPWS